MRWLKGQLLLAGADMLDPNFAQTVTLLIEHNEDGCFGLVLNRPTPMTVAKAWEQVSQAACAHEGFLHQGGPCPGPLMIVHNDADRAMVRISPTLHFTNDKDQVESLLVKPASMMRCFVGYAGWGAGQLEEELERQSWIVTAATASRVFQGPGTPEHWFDLLRHVSPSQAAILRRPELWPSDPSVN